MAAPVECAEEAGAVQRTADSSTADADARPWHAVSVDDVVECLETHRNGLTPAEAERRLEAHGPNSLPTAKPRTALRRLLAQFHDVLIYVLLAAAVLAALLGHGVDTAVILLVVLINAFIGFIQEGRAEKALDAIKGMIEPNASVLRDGHRMVIRAEHVVPGDIVLLEAGDRVPADLRLVRARNLRIEEATLTGESVAVEKGAGPVDAAAALGDRTSMAYSGTFVVAGLGLGVAVATGLSTELGRISAMLGAVEPLTTPLVRQMSRFARQLTIMILGVSALVFAFATGLRHYPWAEAFMAVVGLAVAAIPEGLPAVMTITLAIGVQRMAARNAIIRRLPAVETLGSVSVICSDKTGTLTRNEMMAQTAVTAAGSVEATGEGYEPRGALWRDGREFDIAENPVMQELALAALLCNDAALRQSGSGWVVDGDPMEGALMSFAAKAGCDADATRRQFPRADEIPFDSRHRFMATLHHAHENGSVAYVKGAPERVLSMCSAQQGAQGLEPVDHAHWCAAIEALARKGQRVLALATKKTPQSMQELTFSDVESGLSLLGVVGLIDPPRAEAIMAVEECRNAGIRVKMITGDHAATASAIAQRLGLAHHEAVITGERLQELNEEEFERAAREMTVFARTTPEHKLRLVEALQSQGHVVAMTGDGVNDAPALKRADVGVAMGRKGTEAAKEAAEMVLADDNFASIVAAVCEGRTVYDNLKKVIGWTLPTNGGEAMAIIVAIFFGLTLPMTPVQILWINMVTAVGLGLTLAFEPTEPEVMRRSPRAPSEPVLSGFLIWRVAFVSLLFVAGSFGLFFWAEERGLPIEEARTIVVNAIVIMEIFYLFSIRRPLAASFPWTGLLSAPAIVIGVGAITAAQFLFTYAPFMQTIFDTRSMSLVDAAAVIGVGAGLYLVLELEKFVQRRFDLEAPDAAYLETPSAGRLWQTLAGAVVVAALGSGLLYWTLQERMASRYVREPAERGSTIRTVTTTGIVHALSSEPVLARASGVLQTLYCERGDKVQAGQLCAKIDPVVHQATLDRRAFELAEASARRKQNELRLARAKTALERVQTEAKRGAASRRAVAKSRAALERATTRVAQDEAELVQRRVALRAAEIDLANTEVVSPVDGVVVARNVEMGQMVDAGADAALFQIAAGLATVRVEADVSAQDVARIRLGDRVSFTVDALADHTFEGAVTQIDGRGHAPMERGGNEIVITASNPDLALMPGMGANVRIAVD
ncbi:HAD-IC family P-type ATPase [Methylosinus sp. Ce-a6]|uniref:HAD-IC family P-type ATPase n=1 Tax=Methylosinus sp. Ce-a6 TaxID=2172005 RepID=UPI001358D7C4|nr:HAD-IC family P-type ATPase [Methylosinus sp. Ce-a6]